VRADQKKISQRNKKEGHPSSVPSRPLRLWRGCCCGDGVVYDIGISNFVFVAPLSRMDPQERFPTLLMQITEASPAPVYEQAGRNRSVMRRNGLARE
jgi:hypothetical protein